MPKFTNPGAPPSKVPTGRFADLRFTLEIPVEIRFTDNDLSEWEENAQEVNGDGEVVATYPIIDEESFIRTVVAAGENGYSVGASFLQVLNDDIDDQIYDMYREAYDRFIEGNSEFELEFHKGKAKKKK